MNRYSTLLLGALVFAGCSKIQDSSHDINYTEWRAYAGSVEGNRYSSNDQINASNVANLQVAWTWSSGDKDPENRSQNQCNPLMVEGVL